MRFLFQHGWGFDQRCWQGWLELLDQPCTLGDRGYWGAPCPLEGLDPAPGFVLVTHSLGLHLISVDLLARAGLIVIIGGFAHFHGQSMADGRFSHRHLQKMFARLETDPVGLIRDFYRDCDCPGWPVANEGMDQARLTQDLRLLDQSRLDEKRWGQGLPPTLLLHGREDRIVRPERAQELAKLCKNSQLILIDHAGHGLPFTHPGPCLERIQAIIANKP